MIPYRLPVMIEVVFRFGFVLSAITNQCFLCNLLICILPSIVSKNSSVQDSISKLSNTQKVCLGRSQFKVGARLIKIQSIKKRYRICTAHITVNVGASNFEITLGPRVSLQSYPCKRTTVMTCADHISQRAFLSVHSCTDLKYVHHNRPTVPIGTRRIDVNIS